MKLQMFTDEQVYDIAKKANIPLTMDQAKNLAEGFMKTTSVLDELASVNVGNIEPTNQVTGLENVFREDVIDGSRILSQEQIQANTERIHNGFVVVDQVLADKIL